MKSFATICEINQEAVKTVMKLTEGRHVMHDTTHKVTPQPNTVFGDLYVREQHNDAAEHHLPPSDVGTVITFLKASMFEEVIKSLRHTLGLRRQR